MNILQYQWSNSCPDLEEILRSFPKVNLFSDNISIDDYDNDTIFMEYWEGLIEKNDIDVCISFDFFPVISKVCEIKSVIYISWIYDSPHTTLYSKTLYNNCNYVFSFDKMQVNEFQARGISQIYHQPLAVNINRLDNLLKTSVSIQGGKNNEVSFVGSLYQDNLYEQIIFLPEYIHGYIDGVCKIQSVLYGGSIVEEVLNEDIVSELKKYIVLTMNEEYEVDYRTLFCDNILKKYISSIERKGILKELSRYCKVVLYSNMGIENSCVEFRGLVDYMMQAPRVFRKSALNLNVTIRSIISGVPLRCLDVMGAGGVLISNFQPELAEYFVPDEEWICFGDKEELIEKAVFYLNHEELRMKIAHNGYRKVKQQFTYQQAVDNIFKQVGLYKDIIE